MRQELLRIADGPIILTQELATVMTKSGAAPDAMHLRSVSFPAPFAFAISDPATVEEL